MKNSLSKKFPEISLDWDFELNENLTPDQVTYGSNKKVWWKCKKGHSWEAKISNRTVNTTNCPYCSNQKAGYENTLEKKYPELAKEWDKEKNTLKPSEVVFGSHKKVWWKCKKGHSWMTAVKHRAINKTNCPKCNMSTSIPEIRLLCELKSLFEVSWQSKIGKYKVDIFIPSLSIVIEYDGSYYHKTKEKYDYDKNEYLKNKGFRIIRVREIPLKKMSSSDILVKSNLLTKDDCNTLVKRIVELSKTKISTNKYLIRKGFTNEDLFNYYLSFLPDPFPEISLKSKHPKLIEQWDFKKNDPLIPENFIPGSHHEVWWKCKKGHSWKQSIRDRLSTDYECQICHWDNKKLINTHPELIKQIHPDNNVDVKKINTKAPIKLLWKCSIGHEWKEFVHNRTNSKDPFACPICTKRKKSIVFTKPSLYKEWDHEKNDISPYEVTPGLHIKVWWKCRKGHSWQTRVFQRSRSDRPSDCPKCRKKSMTHERDDKKFVTKK